jgi:hypothetical protein
MSHAHVTCSCTLVYGSERVWQLGLQRARRGGSVQGGCESENDGDPSMEAGNQQLNTVLARCTCHRGQAKKIVRADESSPGGKYCAGPVGMGPFESDRLTPPFVASLFGSKRPLVEWKQPNAHEVLTVILLKPSDTASS